MAKRTNPLPPPRDELVAFLANETDAASAERMQALIDRDPAVRREKELHEAAWQALDLLPRPAAKPGFQERTVSLAATALADAVSRRRMWVWPAATFGGLAAGIAAVALLPDANRQRVRDLPLLAEWREYRDAGDLAFARKLVERTVFPDAVAPPAVRADDVAAAALDAGQREEVRAAAAELAQLPADRQRELRAFAAAVADLPAAEQLAVRAQLHGLSSFAATWPAVRAQQWQEKSPEARAATLDEWRAEAKNRLAAVEKKAGELAAAAPVAPAERRPNVAKQFDLVASESEKKTVGFLSDPASRRPTADSFAYYCAVVLNRPANGKKGPADKGRPFLTNQMQHSLAPKLASCPEFAAAFPFVKSHPVDPGRVAELLVALYQLPAEPGNADKDRFRLGWISGVSATIATCPDGKLPRELAHRLLTYLAFRADPNAIPAGLKPTVEKLQALASREAQAPPRPPRGPFPKGKPKQ